MVLSINIIISSLDCDGGVGDGKVYDDDFNDDDDSNNNNNNNNTCYLIVEFSVTSR
jgi:hypothetical protein